MSDLSLYTRFTLTLPVGTITESGKVVIVRYMRSQRVNEGVWKDKNPDTEFVYLSDLPDTWMWVWVVVGKGEYVGTFPKRVAKFYRNTQGLKCPAEFLTALGNTARAHSSDAITYDFEFVNEIDWEDGEYGDNNSCWWYQYANARETLTTNGGLAIRFYDSEGDGMGRAWVVPHGDVFFLFNGYGFTGDSTLIITRVMADHLGLSYKRVYLSNNGESYNTLYINGGAGYVIGEQDTIEGIDNHDFGFRIVGLTCENCGSDVSDDEYTSPDGDIYCSSCYYDRCNSCERCGETHWNDDLTYVEDDGDYCDHCLNIRFSFCDACYSHHPKADSTFINDSEYCLSCRDENFELCPSCNSWQDTETFVNKDDKTRVCKECAESIDKE